METTLSSRSTRRSLVPPAARQGVDWSIALPLAIAHITALAAPWTYTTLGLQLFFGAYLLSGLGVTLGAHRLFTHQSYRAGGFFRRLMAVFFIFSAQGSLLRWVRDHHIHHAHADAAGDPHSPHTGEGFWHAHMGWLWLSPATRAENKALYARYGGGLNADPFLLWSARPAVLLVLHLLVIGVFYAVGALAEGGLAGASLATGWQGGLSAVVWGVFLRIVLVLHATAFVNSAAHIWGYRSYTTGEASRNNWWVALISLGEGWHNNHHGRPAAANQGFHRWWEFDFSFLVLLVAAYLGLVHDIRVYRPRLGKTETWFLRTQSPQP